jgi:chemotaxis response regulator CheB
MPRAAVEIGAVETQVPLRSVAAKALAAAAAMSVGAA